MLPVQAERLRSVHSVPQGQLLHGFPCNLCAESGTLYENRAGQRDYCEWDYVFGEKRLRFVRCTLRLRRMDRMMKKPGGGFWGVGLTGVAVPTRKRHSLRSRNEAINCILSSRRKERKKRCRKKSQHLWSLSQKYLLTGSHIIKYIIFYIIFNM